MTNYYRPGIGWFPNKPKTIPKGRVWNEQSDLLDWSTGKIIPAQKVLDYNQTAKRGSKIAIDGLRTRTLKSSEERKYHEGGPYNGAKLRKWIKRKGRSPVEILLDKYEISGIIGWYQYDREKDQYTWHTEKMSGI